VSDALPFSAIIGQEELKLALLLIAVDPGIGGVLISGERGTAKSTAARAIASLLPQLSHERAAPFVELPLSATEDRLIGALNLSTVLQEGRSELRSGLLTKADGGVLYVDEVNLLADHLVDLLLDAAASGRVRIERDGLSASENARFLLIGTMNPEEGDLRPQFLDRFALSVHVQNLSSQPERMAAIRARLRFDDDPTLALSHAAEAEDALRAQILAARARLSSLVISDEHLAIVTQLALEQRVAGIRADIAIARAARAFAAWEGAAAIDVRHIERVASMALRHRTRGRRPPRPAPPASTSSPSPAPSTTGPSPTSPPAEAAARNVTLLTDVVDPQLAGRRPSPTTSLRRSQGERALSAGGTLALERTIAAAVNRGASRRDGGLALAEADLREQRLSLAGRSHVLFVVDTSGSMAARQRLSIAKETAVGMLASNQQRRDEVALITFGGDSACLVLPFTRQVKQVDEALAQLPAGGRTPLAGALQEAVRVLEGREPSLLVLLTDGRANVSVAGGDPWSEALAACSAVRAACAGALVIDCENGPVKLGRARLLADALQGDCVDLGDLDATSLELRIRRRVEAL
jgi:magnesium chelatase subunit D